MNLAAPKMIRAELTADQWRDVRLLAVNRGIAAQSIVTEAIVKLLEDNGGRYDEHGNGGFQGVAQ